MKLYQVSYNLISENVEKLLPHLVQECDRYKAFRRATGAALFVDEDPCDSFAFHAEEDTEQRKPFNYSSKHRNFKDRA